ncbi:TY3B-TY3B protein [Mycena indigotica]|uniref:TY3B-TY3B protein n=1 Tax=Mycena indigotica TaxID=2126181 RepID=A0A8H6S4K2_9AGAR|nr:TY3B-TY3B protein [Mycena indigotica]KAF7291190.1 TY3B-TY3B protein [Mycena indigotica]
MPSDDESPTLEPTTRFPARSRVATSPITHVQHAARRSLANDSRTLTSGVGHLYMAVPISNVPETGRARPNAVRGASPITAGAPGAIPTLNSTRFAPSASPNSPRTVHGTSASEARAPSVVPTPESPRSAALNKPRSRRCFVCGRSNNHPLSFRFCPRTCTLLRRALARLDERGKLVMPDGSALPMTRHAGGVAGHLISAHNAALRVSERPEPPQPLARRPTRLPTPCEPTPSQFPPPTEPIRAAEHTGPLNPSSSHPEIAPPVSHAPRRRHAHRTNQPRMLMPLLFDNTLRAHFTEMITTLSKLDPDTLAVLSDKMMATHTLPPCFIHAHLSQPTCRDCSTEGKLLVNIEPPTTRFLRLSSPRAPEPSFTTGASFSDFTFTFTSTLTRILPLLSLQNPSIRAPPIPDISTVLLANTAQASTSTVAFRKKISAEAKPVVAARDVLLGPGSVHNVPVTADFTGREDWFVEKVLISTDDGSILAAPSTLIKASVPVIPIANPSARPWFIRAGDVVGKLRDPSSYADAPVNRRRDGSHDRVRRGDRKSHLCHIKFSGRLSYRTATTTSRLARWTGRGR